MHIIHRLTLTAFAATALMPTAAIAQAVNAPYEQEFMLTAYYSPLPDQCCYVKGSLEADKILNGNGTHGADGTAVYPGMLAAPPTYAFGTRIALPGLGTLTVHDRGGAIQEWDDVHRLDVWAGFGEEGLARALEFGVQHIRGTVYPPLAVQPAESFALESLPAPESKLKPFVVAEAGLIDASPTFGAHGLSVRLMQEQLQTLGYFTHELTGLYGDVTKASLAAFIADMGLTETPDELTQTTAAYLAAAQDLKDAKTSIVFVGKESTPAEIKTAQRTLRYLGFYRGRTDGKYSSILFNAILAYQTKHQLVGDANSPGAGRIGPMTKGVIDKELNKRRIARKAELILALHRVEEALAKSGTLLGVTMNEGMSGKDVTTLQTFLAKKGFFPSNFINGHFGAMTAASVAQYQIARGLLQTTSDKGAGNVGPLTLRTVRNEQVSQMYKVVKAQGWDAL